MNRNSTSPVGALHPVIFMIVVYIISVVLAFFVCRMIYFSINQTASVNDDASSEIKSITAAR